MLYAPTSNPADEFSRRRDWGTTTLDCHTTKLRSSLTLPSTVSTIDQEIAKAAKGIEYSRQSIVARELSLDRKIPVRIRVPYKKIDLQEMTVELTGSQVLDILTRALNLKQIPSTRFNHDSDISAKFIELRKLVDHNETFPIPIIPNRNFQLHKLPFSSKVSINVAPDELIRASELIVNNLKHYDIPPEFSLAPGEDPAKYFHPVRNERLHQLIKDLKVQDPKYQTKSLDAIKPIAFTIDAAIHLESKTNDKSTSLKLHPHKLLSVFLNAVKDGLYSRSRLEEVFGNNLETISDRLEELKTLSATSSLGYQFLDKVTKNKKQEFEVAPSSLLKTIQALIIRLQRSN